MGREVQTSAAADREIANLRKELAEYSAVLGGRSATALEIREVLVDRNEQIVTLQEQLRLAVELTKQPVAVEVHRAILPQPLFDQVVTQVQLGHYVKAKRLLDDAWAAQ